MISGVVFCLMNYTLGNEDYVTRLQVIGLIVYEIAAGALAEKIKLKKVVIMVKTGVGFFYMIFGAEGKGRLARKLG